MSKKIASELLNKLVREQLYEDTEVAGNQTWIVKTLCMTPESEEDIPQEYSFQADSAEKARSMAMDQSKVNGNTSCKVQSVTMVPNSGEELNKYGDGSALNADPEATMGQVLPSDVSKDLPNSDAKA